MIRKSLNKFNGYLLAAIFIAVYAIMTQIYTILAKEPFWLDEFFIIYNLKLRPLKFLTEELAYNQQFPRIYFYIIQLFSKVFNFSYISLRLIPFPFNAQVFFYYFTCLIGKYIPNPRLSYCFSW